MRFGIIGGGNISGTHAKAAVEVGARVVAFHGRHRERVSRLAQEYGAPAYDDLDRFLEHPELDAVIIGTPTGTHAQFGCAAAARGLHVLCEKPLDVTTQHADRLIEACDQAHVTLGVMFQDRVAPELAWLKRVIDRGTLGEIILASAQVRWYRPPSYYAESSWRGTRALDGGGAVINQASHTIDLLLWLLGDVARVSAITRTSLHDIEVEDTAVATLEFSRGGIGTFEAATSAYPGFPRRIEITGTKGTLRIEGDRVISADLLATVPDLPERETADASPRSSSPAITDTRGHGRIIADFMDAVARNRPPLCDGRDGRRSVALIEAIYRSARTGATVIPSAARDLHVPSTDPSRSLP